MKKEMLKKLRTLKATDTMMKMAGMDVPKLRHYGYGGRTCDSYKYGIYMRCQILSGVLKVAFFLADEMRNGINRPVYELFINKEDGEFITWDVKGQKWRNAKVDMLEWPEYTWHSGKYINPEGNRSIKSYLGVSNGGYKGIHEYQLSVRSDELKQRHRRETGPWDMTLEQIPKIPKDFKEWADKKGMKQHYIFYEYSRKCASEGYCTYCDKTVPIDKPKHNYYGKCKCCGREIQFKSRGKAGSFYTNDERIYLLQKCEDGFVVRQFRARRHYYKGKYENAEKLVWEERRVIYDERLYGQAFYYGLYKNVEQRWIKTSVSSYGYYYTQLGVVYTKNLYTLSDKLSRTGLPQMMISMEKQDPEVFIETVKSKPYLEQLAKAGLTRLAFDVVYSGKELNIKTIKDLGKALDIDKYRLGRLRTNNGSFLFLKWLKYEKLNQKNIDDNDIGYFADCGIEPKDIEFILDRMSEKKICNYLKKQYELSKRKPKELISTWNDYLCMANRLKMNTRLELFFKPKDLIASHDEAVKLSGGGEIAKRAGEIAENFPDVDSICQSIKSKYEFADKKYQIIVPDKIEDIIVEGRVLGHCLDRSDIYFERIQKRESYIVFLRKAESPDTPYYTLEIEPGGVARQKRTTGDKQNKDFDNAKKFIRKWQQEIQHRLSSDDMKLAEQSAILRVEEFKELRKSQTKIWRGHLAGKLLVDVLEADLMEVVMCEGGVLDGGSEEKQNLQPA